MRDCRRTSAGCALPPHANRTEDSAEDFVQDLGVQVIGGCCGTTPAHIQSLEISTELTPAQRDVEGITECQQFSYEPAAPRSRATFVFRTIILDIGERLNAMDRKSS